MINCLFTVNNIQYRISNLPGKGTNYNWKPYIFSFTEPKYSISSKIGGYVKLDFGQITISPELFMQPGRDIFPYPDWPPPRNCPVQMWYSDSDTDDEGVRLLKGTAKLTSFGQEGAVYDFWDEDSGILVLEQDTDYNDNKIDMPRVFGRYDHYTCIKMADFNDGVDDLPAYHMAYMNLTTYARGIIKIENDGFGKARFTCDQSHGFIDGETVITEDVNNYYWDESAISSVTSTEFTKVALDFVSAPTYKDATSARFSPGESWTQTAGHVYKRGWFRVYDDGVPITSNAYFPLYGRASQFALNYMPVGTVTCSGTGSKEWYVPGPTTELDFSLRDFIQWGCYNDKLAVMLFADISANDIKVSVLVDSQKNLLDLYDEVTKSFHYFFVIYGSNELHLRNMTPAYVDPTFVLQEHDYFNVECGYGTPVKMVKMTWELRESFEDNTGKTVKETNNTTSIGSASDPFGEDMEIPYYGYANESDVTAQQTFLYECLTIQNKADISVTMPLQFNSIPLIGNLIRVINQSAIRPLTIEFRVRSLSYGFEANQIGLSGDGDVYLYEDGHEIASNQVASTAFIGTGLAATYYNNITLNGALYFSRTDSTINFDWGYGIPGVPLTTDYWSIRWIGKVQAESSGRYQFRVVSNDGVKLLVNEELLVNAWTSGDHDVTATTTATFVENNKYDIMIEYYEAYGPASIRLEWKLFGSSDPFVIVPQRCLYPIQGTRTSI
jgi:mannan endo-1,4-beta-mannosidase